MSAHRSSQTRLDPKILDARSQVRMAQLTGVSVSVQVRALAVVPLSTERTQRTDREVLRAIHRLLGAPEQSAEAKLDRIEEMLRQQLGTSSASSVDEEARQLAREINAIKRAS